MDLGNLKMEKQNLLEVKDVNKKEQKTKENKDFCIKVNDYLNF